MTLDFGSNLCCLCSPRNTCIPVFVYSAVKERLIKCRRVSFQLWKEQVLSWAPFSPVFLLPQNTDSWEFVLRSEAFEAISDLLNLLLK